MKKLLRDGLARLAVLALVVATGCTSPLAASTTNIQAAPAASAAEGAKAAAESRVDSRLTRLEGVSAATNEKPTGVEPDAGSWKTWLLSSGSQFRPSAPPDKTASRDEVDQLLALVPGRDAAALEQIRYWDEGGPVYRWNAIALEELLKHNANANLAMRALSLVHTAAYDAIIATWDAKYTYNRQRPSDLDHRLSTVIPNPNSPSFPSEYAAVASASSAILAYLYPDSAGSLSERAAAAGRSRLLAGVEYPSDVEAGVALGKKVAELAIERGKADGSAVQWTGSVPTEPGHWTGTNPALPLAGTWKTWVLSSGSEFRPGPPPAYNSPEMAAELAQVEGVQRTPKMTADAVFWEYGAGGLRAYWFWNQQLTQLILAHGQAANPPLEARSYALANVAGFDSSVSCWDAKYTYWAPRPFQLDPNFKPLFTTPNHPSYPSAHSCISTAVGAMLSYLFPSDASAMQALADGASQSRVWAGIHFPSDVSAGQGIGRSVAQKVIERAQADGSSK